MPHRTKYFRGVCIAMLGLSSSDGSSDYSYNRLAISWATESTSFLGGSINHNRTSSEASSIHTRAVQYPQQKCSSIRVNRMRMNLL